MDYHGLRTLEHNLEATESQKFKSTKIKNNFKNVVYQNFRQISALKNTPFFLIKKYIVTKIYITKTNFDIYP